MVSNYTRTCDLGLDQREDINKMAEQTQDWLPIDTAPITLTRYTLEKQKKIPSATGDFTNLINSLQTAVKAVSSAVRKAGISRL